ncbi:MAG: CCDC90 family protein [Pseudomonadota bacterium]|nr:CCDC90 family protein [Pseudomonadota bacterium]
MAAAMIDTLKLVQKLRDGGMPITQAEAVAAGINEAMADSMVTKNDLAAAEARIGTVIANSRNTMIVWTVGAVFALGIIQHFFK